MVEQGYAGKILKIDLSTGLISHLPTSDYSERFLGGRGIGVKLYWDQVSPEIGAFDPDNCLIFATGPLGAYPGLAGSRWQVSGKSPMNNPETFSYANFGGSWGAWLKFAGYDAIILHGRSDKLVYIQIDDSEVKIQDAGHLQGKGAIETREHLKKRLGKDTRIAAIGAAGENMAVMASITADEDSSGSAGFGAVMGSKKIKAIAVRANQKQVSVADPELLDKLKKELCILRDGSRFIFSGANRVWSNYVPENITLNPHLKQSICFGCINGCSRATYHAEDGSKGKYLCVSAVFYADPTKKIGEWDDAHFHANRLCNEHGLDVVALVTIIGWLRRCYQAGILTESNTDFPLSKMGSLEFLSELIRKIAFREGFGDILARGLVSAAEAVGDGAVEQLGTIFPPTGQAYPYEPRQYIITALPYVTEPRLSMPQLHEVVFPTFLWYDWQKNVEAAYVDGKTISTISQTYMGSKDGFDFSNYKGKALAAKKIQDRVYAKECLILCDFAWPMMDVRHSQNHVGDPTLASKVLTAVVGKKYDEVTLDLIGERVLNLQRAIAIREGHEGIKDDVLPETDYTVPLPKRGGTNPESLMPGKNGEAIPRAGKVIDRGQFDAMRRDYYILRRWDPETGYQTDDVLKDLDLGKETLNQ